MTDRSDCAPHALGANLPSPIVLKIGVFLDLTSEEIHVLNGLCSKEIRLSKNQEFHIAGGEINSAYVVKDGWLCSHRMLLDGRRQIVSFALPGDIVNLSGVYFGTSLWNITAITDVTVCVVPFQEIATLSVSHPRIGAAIAWLNAREQNILAEQVVRTGRRTAYERMAHLILELYHRLEQVKRTEDEGNSSELTYELPIIQELLGDALGLSLVHVNRVLTRLREAELIQMRQHRMKITDFDRLMEVAEFDPSYLRHERIPKPALSMLANTA